MAPFPDSDLREIICHQAEKIEEYERFFDNLEWALNFMRNYEKKHK